MTKNLNIPSPYFWLFFFLWLGARLFFMATAGLGDDEAYYWDWSRQLALSYYDHPPLTAWLIYASTSIFGHTPLGVRLPAFLCTLTTAHFLFYLARDMYSERVAKGSVLLYLLIPLFSLGGILMVPDAPMGALWLATAYIAWQLHDKKWPFALGIMAIGFLLGLGFLSKYPIVFCGLSVLIFFFLSPTTQGFWKKPSFWLAIGVFILCSLPILLWNQAHNWPSFAFHLKGRQTGGFEITRWIQFLASQVGLLTPIIFYYGVVAVRKCWSTRASDRSMFLLVMMAPVLLVFGIQPLFAEFKPHWLAPIYPFLFISLSHFYFAEWSQSRIVQKWLLPLSAGLCVLLSVVFYANLKTPIIARINTTFSGPESWNPKQDPAADLLGWDQLGIHLRKLKEHQEQLRLAPTALASWRYQLVAQIAFATQDNVYRISDHRDQYTFSQHLDDIKNHWIIFVTDHRYTKEPTEVGLNNCQPQHPFDFERQGFLTHRFFVWVCPPLSMSDK